MTTPNDAEAVLALVTTRLRSPSSNGTAYLLLFDERGQLTGFLAISPRVTPKTGQQ